MKLPPVLLVALAAAGLLVAGFACPACSTLQPKGTFETDYVEDLVTTVAERTTDYVEADQALGNDVRAERLAEIATLEGAVQTQETMTKVSFRALAEEVFSWHDAYVASGTDPPHKQQRWLRSTQILRDKYFDQLE